MNTSPRHKRTLDEMVDALRRHVKLLHEYCSKAFVDNDGDYYGEIAAKLRLLVVKAGANTPLLIRLERETDIDPEITLVGARIPMEKDGEILAGKKLSVQEYMDLDAIGIRTPSGNFETLTKKELVLMWAQQTGAAHEDWTMSEALREMLKMRIFIGGMQGAVSELQAICKAVLDVADRFLAELDGSKGAA
jgi:hypothetical protein